MTVAIFPAKSRKLLLTCEFGRDDGGNWPKMVCRYFNLYQSRYVSPSVLLYNFINRRLLCIACSCSRFKLSGAWLRVLRRKFLADCAECSCSASALSDCF